MMAQRRYDYFETFPTKAGKVDLKEKFYSDDRILQFDDIAKMLASRGLSTVFSLPEKCSSRRDNPIMEALSPLVAPTAAPFSLTPAAKLQDQFYPSPDDIPLPKFETVSESKIRHDKKDLLDAAVQTGQGAEQHQHCVPRPPNNHSSDSADSFDGLLASVGSIGHPTNCAEACKYIMKKRSCKQGQLCTRCHLCKRRHLGKRLRPRAMFCEYGSINGEALRDVQEVGVGTEDLEMSVPQVSTDAISIGTIGHPTRCGPACRYTWRKDGCKHGRDCYCCHLCNWSRLS